MYPTILDTVTGDIKACIGGTPEFSVFWWTEGNGSCDCNRYVAMGYTEANPCTWSRFLIIGAKGNLEEETEEEIVRMANSAYPVWRPSDEGIMSKIPYGIFSTFRELEQNII